MLAARFRRHHQHFKCCRDQVRLFLAYLHRFKSGGGPSDALRRLGSWREGGSRQQHFARRRATGIFGKNAGVEGSKADKLLDAVKEKFATIQPIPRSDVTDDIGNAAAFLASDRASFIHGHDLVVDGGITLWGQRWNDEIELRASLSSKIKETIDRLNN
ncbi:MAG TPA: SDR family oxidoreductase [Acetobacteraceae bacterium]|nr:SDR family oxidoreductase [Acetobacteraceae bacterium]